MEGAVRTEVRVDAATTPFGSAAAGVAGSDDSPRRVATGEMEGGPPGGGVPACCELDGCDEGGVCRVAMHARRDAISCFISATVVSISACLCAYLASSSCSHAILRSRSASCASFCECRARSSSCAACAPSSLGLGAKGQCPSEVKQTSHSTHLDTTGAGSGGGGGGGGSDIAYSSSLRCGTYGMGCCWTGGIRGRPGKWPLYERRGLDWTTWGFSASESSLVGIVIWHHCPRLCRSECWALCYPPKSTQRCMYGRMWRRDGYGRLFISEAVA